MLVGRVGLHGEALSVRLELIEAEGGRRLWAAGYDRKLSDVLTLESEISRDVAKRLRPRLSGEDQTRIAKPPGNMLARCALATGSRPRIVPSCWSSALAPAI